MKVIRRINLRPFRRGLAPRTKPPIRASSTAPSLYHFSEETPFSNEFAHYLFRPAKPTRVFRFARTLPNMLRRIHNGYWDLREIGIAFGKHEREPVQEWPIMPAFQAIRDRLTPIGVAFRDLTQGKAVVDLGSGSPQYSLVPRILAQIFGATSYEGVDINPLLKPRTRTNEFGKIDLDFTSTFHQDDMLQFLQRYERQGPTLFFMEGIEYDRSRPDSFQPTFEYFQSVMDQIGRISRPGDGLFVGRVVSFLHPQEDMLQLNHEARVGSLNMPRVTFSTEKIIDPSSHGFGRIASQRVNAFFSGENKTTNDRYDLWLME